MKKTELKEPPTTEYVNTSLPTMRDTLSVLSLPLIVVLVGVLFGFYLKGIVC